MEHKIIIAGFGGQGVQSMGQMLAYAGMLEGKGVSWLPSYGPEMRGGTTNCNVIIADGGVGSPVVTRATSVMALNLPSLDKFENSVVPGGDLYINSSLVDRKCARDDINVYYIPCNELAAQIGNARVANIVMLGAFLEKSKAVSIQSVLDAIPGVLGERKKNLVPINKVALEKGATLV
ncbi:MAG: 2-oxoacid:acceptor oxidoreductase family protein [Christensenellales bacterium]|jgi:2-oxoglutarate ferredoxin oxidoreductase subunit gamma